MLSKLHRSSKKTKKIIIIIATLINRMFSGHQDIFEKM